MIKTNVFVRPHYITFTYILTVAATVSLTKPSSEYFPNTADNKQAKTLTRYSQRHVDSQVTEYYWVMLRSSSSSSSRREQKQKRRKTILAHSPKVKQKPQPTVDKPMALREGGVLKIMHRGRGPRATNVLSARYSNTRFWFNRTALDE